MNKIYFLIPFLLVTFFIIQIIISVTPFPNYPPGSLMP